MTNDTVLEVRGLRKRFRAVGEGSLLHPVYAEVVRNVSFQLRRGETFGLVGESGCGKSTVAKLVMGLEKPTSGEIYFCGQRVDCLTEGQRRHLRPRLQMVFQDTLSALNPRGRIGDILEETLIIHGMGDAAKRRETVLEILQKVGLSEEHYFRYPHELSGGQVQRLGIAGALIIQPKLIVCDEPVSALDVSIQAQILNMLMDLQKELRISLLFISHDIGVVRYISDRVGVMYLGSMMEEAGTEELFENPLHPYTKALFAAAPDPYIQRREVAALNGEQPVRTEKFAGCAFCTRCPYATEKCRQEEPKLREVKSGHKVACHLAE